MRLRDVLRRVMGVSYTAMKSAKWNGGITVDGVVTPVDAFVRAERQPVPVRMPDGGQRAAGAHMVSPRGAGDPDERPPAAEAPAEKRAADYPRDRDGDGARCPRSDGH